MKSWELALREIKVFGRLKLMPEPGAVAHGFNASTQGLGKADLCDLPVSIRAFATMYKALGSISALKKQTYA